MAIFIPTSTSEILTLEDFIQEVLKVYTGQEQLPESTLFSLAKLLQQLGPVDLWCS
jgi:hypothetical protein